MCSNGIGKWNNEKWKWPIGIIIFVLMILVLMKIIVMTMCNVMMKKKYIMKWRKKESNVKESNGGNVCKCINDV